jgi:hypothetical protein
METNTDIYSKYEDGEDALILNMKNVRTFVEYGVDEDDVIEAHMLLAEFALDDSKPENVKRNLAQKYLRRLYKEGTLRQFGYGRYRKPSEPEELDFAAEVPEVKPTNIKLPLGANDVVVIEHGEMVVVGGQVNAGKSTFMFEVLARNYKEWPIRYFYSKELSDLKIHDFKKRMSIDGSHKNIRAFKMKPNFEDFITGEKAIYLFDYIRLGENQKPWYVDDQLAAVLEKIGEGVAFTAIQAHSGNNYKLKGGDYALMVPHHGFVLNRDTGLIMVAKSKTPGADFKVKQYRVGEKGLYSDYKNWVDIAELSSNRQDRQHGHRRQ